MLADWIGSNSQPGWFPYRALDHALDEYWLIALERARSP